MRRRNKKHYSIYIAWIVLLLCVIAGLKAGIEESAGENRSSGTGTSIQSRWEELWKEETDSTGNAKEEAQKETEQQEEAQKTQKNIRVLLLTDGYRQTVHKTVEVSAAGGLVIDRNGTREEKAENEKVSITKEDAGFQNGKIRIEPKNNSEIVIHSLRREYGNPSYAGILDLYATSEGVVIVNELPVEEYLCKVVPSEMPSGFQKEALKAQAVCARNYACRQMEKDAYPEYEADVNDSTDYQVYNNTTAQQASTEAVRETEGEVLTYKGQIVTTYYYSTSCGKTTTMEAWGADASDSNGYLQSVKVKDQDGDYEKNLPWYRWEADIDEDVLSGLIRKNTGKDIGKLQSLEVTKTGAGGVALQIKASGEKGSVTVETENKIRRALGGEGYRIKKQDGTEVKSAALLPSAFFKVEKSGSVFRIRGGGYGHGIGMSQNGANEMAQKGKDYREILQLFYPGTTLERESEDGNG